jgi:hypothetical protein
VTLDENGWTDVDALLAGHVPARYIDFPSEAGTDGPGQPLL